MKPLLAVAPASAPVDTKVDRVVVMAAPDSDIH